MLSKNYKLLIWLLIALGIALAPWIVLAQEKPLYKQKFNIDRTSEDGIGYGQAVKVGKTLYISGSVGSGNWKRP